MGTEWYLVTAAGELHYTEFCILADLYKGGGGCSVRVRGSASSPV